MSLSWGKSQARFAAKTATINKVLNKGIQDVVDKTGKHLQFRARVETPKDTGKGKRSWARATKKSGKDRTVTVFNTARVPKSVSGKWAGAYYLYFVEYGTIYMSPRRFFLKAQNQASVKQRMYMKKLGVKLSTRFNTSFGTGNFRSSISPTNLHPQTIAKLGL